MAPSDSDRPAPERSRRLRLPPWAAVAALGIVALTVVAAVVAPDVPGTQRACPAIGYSSVLEVTLDGDTSEVAVLQVRDGDHWQPLYPPDAEVPAIPTSHDGDTWTFTLFYPPNLIALRALDDDGDVLEQTEFDVGWVRVGGTAECGGPTEAEVTWVR
ncbi:hypothetical protein [Cellulosimicrobium arenosum]|uniref:Uncharacterized protein n=1 Tax=Cellulosimicrobium arenosum TaxID=2708133 RepID=A0A927J207_9MICO|nr:hypothetical protein [Cellulosimicrobium arenosum]MBD8080398.1 hypothetical protein [Cellulosimicrobium arenosum]